MMQVNRIPTPVSPGDLDQSTGVLASAFHDDPLWQFLLPEIDRRVRTLDAFFRAVLTFSLTNQSVYRAGELLAAVAVWGFPGQAKTIMTSQGLGRFLKLAAGSFLISAFRAGGSSPASSACKSSMRRIRIITCRPSASPRRRKDRDWRSG